MLCIFILQIEWLLSFSRISRNVFPLQAIENLIGYLLEYPVHEAYRLPYTIPYGIPHLYPIEDLTEYRVPPIYPVHTL